MQLDGNRRLFRHGRWVGGEGVFIVVGRRVVDIDVAGLDVVVAVVDVMYLAMARCRIPWRRRWWRWLAWCRTEVPWLLVGASALTSKVVGLGTRSTLFAPRWTGCATARMWERSTTVTTLLLSSRVVVWVGNAALLSFVVVATVDGGDGRISLFTWSCFDDAHLSFGRLHGACNIHQLCECERRFR